MDKAVLGDKLLASTQRQEQLEAECRRLQAAADEVALLRVTHEVEVASALGSTCGAEALRALNASLCAAASAGAWSDARLEDALAGDVDGVVQRAREAEESLTQLESLIGPAGDGGTVAAVRRAVEAAVETFFQQHAGAHGDSSQGVAARVQVRLAEIECELGARDDRIHELSRREEEAVDAAVTLREQVAELQLALREARSETNESRHREQVTMSRLQARQPVPVSVVDSDVVDELTRKLAVRSPPSNAQCGPPCAHPLTRLRGPTDRQREDTRNAAKNAPRPWRLSEGSCGDNWLASRRSWLSRCVRWKSPRRPTKR